MDGKTQWASKSQGEYTTLFSKILAVAFHKNTKAAWRKEDTLKCTDCHRCILPSRANRQGEAESVGHRWHEEPARSTGEDPSPTIEAGDKVRVIFEEVQ